MWLYCRKPVRTLDALAACACDFTSGPWRRLWGVCWHLSAQVWA